MIRHVTATEAKAKIVSLLDDVVGGDEIEITRHGRPVARLVPVAGAAALRDRFRGVAMTVDDDDELFSTGARWELD